MATNKLCLTWRRRAHGLQGHMRPLSGSLEGFSIALHWEIYAGSDPVLSVHTVSRKTKGSRHKLQCLSAAPLVWNGASMRCGRADYFPQPRSPVPLSFHNRAGPFYCVWVLPSSVSQSQSQFDPSFIYLNQPEDQRWSRDQTVLPSQKNKPASIRVAGPLSLCFCCAATGWRR